MSDTMLLGVLRMPFDLAMATLTEQIQYHQRGVQAADEIEKLRAEVERLRKALLWYADHRNHFPVLHHRAGYPDPVAVFVEEPPIMTDGGRRAREAMEAKP